MFTLVVIGDKLINMGARNHADIEMLGTKGTKENEEATQITVYILKKDVLQL